MAITATTRALSASRDRSAEIYHLHTAAGYEAGVREPGCWDHIGRHMRSDAEPVRLARRPMAQPRQPASLLTRACMLVMALSFIAAVVRACGGAA